jgi:mRNA interferase RelE/StbE
MIYEIKLDKDVLKFLKKCDKSVVENFFAKTDIMSHNPFDSRLDVKKLNPPLHGHRLRVSKYRFLFDIIQDTIMIYFYKADTR